MSFTSQIVAGLLLGVGLGVFAGELAAPLGIAGDAFIALLQMTVLPYIVVSLVGNLGRISWSESRKLLVSAIAVLAAFLGLGALVLVLAPLSFPSWEAAAFFSTSLVEAPTVFDFVALYIPANPFEALANNVVPAVVLFSILLGVGLSGVPGNQGVLDAMDALATALNKVNKLVIRLTPWGVFAIAAATAGTLSLEEISRLQGYVITYTVVAVVLTFAVLPLLVSALTPFGYREIFAVTRDTLITIFAAAKIIVVLPQLVENVKELFRRHGLENDEVDAGADVLLPLAYPFPNLGTYAILMFVPFAAWYVGRSFELADHLTFHAAALLSSFVAPIIGIPFLLDLLRIPSDMLDLFIVSTVYTDRIRVVLGAMHLVALALIVLAFRRGVLRVDALRLARAAVVSIVLFVSSLLGVRAYLAYAFEGAYHSDEDLVEMYWLQPPRDFERAELSRALREQAVAVEGRLGDVLERGSLRVGYLPDSLPFAFVNAAGEVVGFDIELGHRLAETLGVDFEAVRLDHAGLADALATGEVDVVMSGLAITAARSLRWHFSEPAMDLTLAFLVPDHRRQQFSSRQAVRALGPITLGVVLNDPAFRSALQESYPDARLVEIDTPRPFLRGQQPELDAVVYSAQGGSAWTLLYPSYTVAVPMPDLVEVPMGYPLPLGDPRWSDFVSEWIRLKRKDGTVDALFDHWILGGGAERRGPRWSVVRDVLGWVD